MSKQPSDSFLPSGAIDSSRRPFGRSDSMISPMMVPRSIPDYISSTHTSGGGSPNNFMSSHSPSQRPPISPPKTRSGSAEDSTASLVEDWRAYTQKLRSQNEGERTHMAADRARMEEVMAEERALWDKERDILKARIADLEAQLEGKGSNTSIPFPISHRPQRAISVTSPGSNAVSTGSISSASRSVPQESGRDADGSPFYAPAPRNPSRTFDPSETAELRVDSLTAPRESVIRVTSKELTSSDFGVQSPTSSHDLETINESPAESIDISHIQPELEGVAIRASAVSPTFAAMVLSPYRSPSKLSPDIMPPTRDVTNHVRSPREEKERKTLEVATQPENRRLTMHAGHTPNHSISKFSFLGGDAESGNATPTQEHHHETESIHRPSVAPAHDEEEDEDEDDAHQDPDCGDKELSGPLGFTNEAGKDDAFLAQLVEKLEEARKSADASPSSESGRSLSPCATREPDDDEEEKDGGPKLRLKPSFNFGRPLGSM